MEQTLLVGKPKGNVLSVQLDTDKITSHIVTQYYRDLFCQEVLYTICFKGAAGKSRKLGKNGPELESQKPKKANLLSLCSLS